jgi:hypothetical protein
MKVNDKINRLELVEKKLVTNYKKVEDINKTI